MSAPRVVRGGKVAVLVSPGYGAGWSSWGARELREQKLFCPRLVEALERAASVSELESIAKEEFPDEYEGGVHQLKVAWVQHGEPFRVVEYDGAEHLESWDVDLVTP